MDPVQRGQPDLVHHRPAVKPAQATLGGWTGSPVLAGDAVIAIIAGVLAFMKRDAYGRSASGGRAGTARPARPPGGRGLPSGQSSISGPQASGWQCGHQNVIRPSGLPAWPDPSCRQDDGAAPAAVAPGPPVHPVLLAANLHPGGDVPVAVLVRVQQPAGQVHGGGQVTDLADLLPGARYPWGAAARICTRCRCRPGCAGPATLRPPGARAAPAACASPPRFRSPGRAILVEAADHVVFLGRGEHLDDPCSWYPTACQVSLPSTSLIWWACAPGRWLGGPATGPPSSDGRVHGDAALHLGEQGPPRDSDSVTWRPVRSAGVPGHPEIAAGSGS